MAIVQQPDSLSLSGNLKDFKVASAEQVSFMLRQGSELILSQTYDPGDDNLVSISLKNFITGRLSFLMKETSDVYEQPDIAAEFTAVIDTESVTFKVIRAGVDRLADTPENFLKSNFLTWQPQTKQVTYSTPEYLTCYAVVSGVIKLKAYFTDDAGTVIDQQTIPLYVTEAGKAYTIPLQYAVIASKFVHLPAFYDVWFENGFGDRLSYIQRYVASGLKSYQEQWILFENSLGGLDTFRACGATDFTGEHTHNIAQIEDEAYEYRIDTERKYAKNTGYLNGHERRWLLDFFPSAAKYIFSGNTFRRIVVTESNVTYTDKELPSNYTFTYKYADARPFLNLPRSEVSPGDDLHIVIPDLGSFTMPPRLVELPRLVLTEGALFPVQSPYTEEWNTTTMGAIFAYVSERFTGEGSGGGPGTGVLDERYLRKDADDIAAGHIAFAKSARSAIYREGADGKGWILSSTGSAILEEMQVRKDISLGGRMRSDIYLGGMDGKGWEIDPAGSAILDDLRIRKDIYLGGKFGSVAFASGFTGFGIQIDTADASETLDYLTVRKTMQVYELVYSQVYGLGGSVIISDLNKIASVDMLPDGQTYRCVIDTMDDTMRMNLRAGDIVRMQRSSGIHIRYFYGRVTGVTPDYFDMKVMDGVDAPEAGDVVFRFGSTTDTNRQGIIYLTSSDDHAPYLDIVDGVTDMSMVNKTKARLGNLSGIRTQSGVHLSGYGLYAQGAVFENSEIYLADGNKIEQWFSIYEGRLESAISSILDDMSGQEGNILRNSSFYRNLYYWTSANRVHFINLGDSYLWVDTFYVEKATIADIFYDGSRNVLRMKNTVLKQTNDLFLGHPLQEGTHSVAFFYKVLQAGTLTFGIPDTDLYRSEELTASANYQKYYIEEQWDGTGDFQIGFTGEILIYGLSLRADTLSDAIIRMQTKIEQTQESIKLLATKEYVNSVTGEIYEHYDTELLITAQQISATANRITALETAAAGWVTTAQGNTLWANKSVVDSMGNTVLSHESKITQQANSIELVVREVSGIEQDLATHESKITQLSDYIELAVSELDSLTGNELVSRINLDSTSVTIQAAKIKLEGDITANGNVHINTDGTLIAKGGIFNGFIQFPFKELTQSDATQISPPNGIKYMLGSDVNLIVEGYTLVLPNHPSYNGCVVNIFNGIFPPWTYASGAMFADVEREDGKRIWEVAPVFENTVGSFNVTPQTRIVCAGSLFQFMCIVRSGSIEWMLINRQYILPTNT